MRYFIAAVTVWQHAIYAVLWGSLLVDLEFIYRASVLSKAGTLLLADMRNGSTSVAEHAAHGGVTVGIQWLFCALAFGCSLFAWARRCALIPPSRTSRPSIPPPMIDILPTDTDRR